MSSGLAKQLLKLDQRAPLTFAIGVVTSITPLTVQINGDDTVDIPNPPVNADYTPAVDDVVFILRPGVTFLVLCKIA